MLDMTKPTVSNSKFPKFERKKMKFFSLDKQAYT